jgi:hypothetical protein
MMGSKTNSRRGLPAKQLMNTKRVTAITFHALWLAFALALGWPLLTEAQNGKPGADSKPKKLPDAKEVIARHVRGIGGAEALAKIESQKMLGRFEMPAQGVGGELLAYGKRPDKLFIKITLPGIGEMLQGYDGKVGWALNPATGPMLLEGRMLEQVREQAQFDSMLHEQDDYKSMETIELTEFGGKECYKVRLVRNSGREIVEYYDKESALLVGTTEAQETPLGLITVTSQAEDYKRFGELLFATRLTQKIGPLAQVITISSIEFNGVNDEIFDLPESIKVLVKH